MFDGSHSSVSRNEVVKTSKTGVEMSSSNMNYSFKKNTTIWVVSTYHAAGFKWMTNSRWFDHDKNFEFFLRNENYRFNAIGYLILCLVNDFLFFIINFYEIHKRSLSTYYIPCIVTTQNPDVNQCYTEYSIRRPIKIWIVVFCLRITFEKLADLISYSLEMGLIILWYTRVDKPLSCSILCMFEILSGTRTQIKPFLSWFRFD